MTQAVEADICAASRIVRPEPLHAVGHRVATVARGIVGAVIAVIGVGSVVGRGEHSADDGAADYSCANTGTATPSSSAAPSHGLDIRWGGVLESETIGRHCRCIVRKRHNAHGKHCRRSEYRHSVSHDLFFLSWFAVRPRGSEELLSL